MPPLNDPVKFLCELATVSAKRTTLHFKTRLGSNKAARFPGRVPHVRPSVHGPKRRGAAPSNPFAPLAKAVGASKRRRVTSESALRLINVTEHKRS
jgi:hypothetical protein